MDRCPNWAWWTIAGGILLSPVFAFLLAVVIANHVTNEGETTWFEGLQLLAVYVVLAVTFGYA